MNNEETKNETPNINPLLKDATALAERIEKATSEAKQEANRLEQLRAEQMLSGTAGIRPNMELAKIETAKEYADKVMHNKIGVKHD